MTPNTERQLNGILGRILTARRRQKELIESAEVCANWMQRWLDQEECECEYGHSCGKAERARELARLYNAIEAMRKGGD